MNLYALEPVEITSTDVMPGGSTTITKSVYRLQGKPLEVWRYTLEATEFFGYSGRGSLQDTRYGVRVDGRITALVVIEDGKFKKGEGQAEIVDAKGYSLPTDAWTVVVHLKRGPLPGNPFSIKAVVNGRQLTFPDLTRGVEYAWNAVPAGTADPAREPHPFSGGFWMSAPPLPIPLAGSWEATDRQLAECGKTPQPSSRRPGEFSRLPEIGNARETMVRIYPH